jgi:hypothetical protein
VVFLTRNPELETLIHTKSTKAICYQLTAHGFQLKPHSSPKKNNITRIARIVFVFFAVSRKLGAVSLFFLSVVGLPCAFNGKSFSVFRGLNFFSKELDNFS